MNVVKVNKAAVDSYAAKKKRELAQLMEAEKKQEMIQVTSEEVEDEYLTAVKGDSKKLLPFKCKECLLYFIFVMLFGFTAILSRSADSSAYRVTSQLKSLLFQENINDHGPIYVDLVQESEMWDYIETLMLPRLLTETSSGNGQAITEQKNQYLVNTNNKLMGGIRIRSQRVEPETCLIQNALFPDCRDDRYQTQQTLHNFNTAFFPNGVKFKTKTENNDALLPWVGRRRRYDGAGYTVDLPLNLSLALEIVQDLRANAFVDRLTSVVVMDFNTYNALVNLHTVSRLAIEFTEMGGALPSYDIKTWKIFRYHGASGLLIMGLEAILILFVLYFTYDEIKDFIQSPGYVYFNEERNGAMMAKVIGQNEDNELLKVRYDDITMTTEWIDTDDANIKYISGCSCSMYFEDKWNAVDLVNIILFDATIALRIYDIITRDNSKYSDVNNFQSYRNIDNMFKIEMALQMFNGFILVIKLMKYMTFSKRIQFLFAILAHSAQDLVIFSIVLFVLFGAFGFSGFLLFSSDVESFRTFPHSFLNLFRFLIGDVDYDKLAESSTIYGSIFYCSWGVIMLLILANVFIAILCDAYVEVKKLGAGEDEQSIFNLLRTPFKKLKRWSTAHGFDDGDLNQDGQISVDELAQTANVSTVAAKKFLNAYDKNGDGTMDREEFKRLKKNRALEKFTTELEKKQGQKFTRVSSLLGIEDYVEEEHANEDKMDTTKELYNFMLSIKAEIKKELQEMKAMIKRNNQYPIIQEAEQ